MFKLRNCPDFFDFSVVWFFGGGQLEVLLENLRNAERAAREKREEAVKTVKEAAEIKIMGSSTE